MISVFICIGGFLRHSKKEEVFIMMNQNGSNGTGIFFAWLLFWEMANNITTTLSNMQNIL